MQWDQEKFVYLASADQWQGMKPFLEQHKIMQCQNFYSVIGGFGGLNILQHLNRPKNIVLFDTNKYMLLIAKLQIELITLCNSVDDYISLTFCREFNQDQYDYDTQNKFLTKPVNSTLHQQLKSILTPESFSTYNQFYHPHIVNPKIKNLQQAVTVHCAQLLPFCESESVRSPLVRPFSFHVDNINTFYVGKGWLTNNDTYNQVKFNFLNATTMLLYQNIEQYIPTENHNGLYGSNIWSTDPEYSGWKKIEQYYDWIIGYDDYIDVTVQHYDKAPIQYDAQYGKGCNNPHESCCQAIDNVLDLKNNKFLEVIEPHPSEGMNYGFRFYNGQIKISTQDFLTLNEKFDIIGIHILLGGGVNKEVWYKICQKAYQLSNRYLFIFEHRKECTDWETKEWDVSDENLLPERELDEYIFSLDYRWKKYGCANLKGQENDPRNIMYFLNKQS